MLGLALAYRPDGRLGGGDHGNPVSPLPSLLAGRGLVLGLRLPTRSTPRRTWSSTARPGSIPFPPRATAPTPPWRLARALHVATWLLLGIVRLAGRAFYCHIGWRWHFILGALVFEHRLCRHSGDLTRINIAFFNMNALVGLISRPRRSREPDRLGVLPDCMGNILPPRLNP